MAAFRTGVNKMMLDALKISRITSKEGLRSWKSVLTL